MKRNKRPPRIIAANVVVVVVAGNMSSLRFHRGPCLPGCHAARLGVMRETGVIMTSFIRLSRAVSAYDVAGDVIPCHLFTANLTHFDPLDNV